MNRDKKVFLVLDLETTGFGFNAGVTEIVVKWFREEYDEISTLIDELTKPMVTIPQNIVELNGITNAMVRGREEFTEVFHRLSSVIDSLKRDGYNVYMVAHNMAFEKRFLAWNLTQRAFKSMEMICTRNNHLFIKDGDIQKNKFTKEYSRLENVAEYYSIEFDKDKAHRAEYDVDITIEIFKRQLKDMKISQMETLMK